jgi:hypothetical protein
MKIKFIPTDEKTNILNDLDKTHKYLKLVLLQENHKQNTNDKYVLDLYNNIGKDVDLSELGLGSGLVIFPLIKAIYPKIEGIPTFSEKIISYCVSNKKLLTNIDFDFNILIENKDIII